MSFVTTAEATEFIRFDGTTDTTIQILIDAAEAFVEDIGGIGLTQSSRVEYFDGGHMVLYPDRRPVSVLASVYDVLDDSALSTDEYHLITVENAIYYGDTDERYMWPRGWKRWKVTYTSGFSTPPDALKLPILVLVDRYWRTRGNITAENFSSGSVDFGEAFGSSDLLSMISNYCARAVAGA